MGRFPVREKSRVSFLSRVQSGNFSIWWQRIPAFAGVGVSSVERNDRLSGRIG
ncbi:Uncharacterized protein dnm_009660 [Desulfonema magnum]|uniref:Uncharacterized protein n=1 Tax=Desulfonema magnum TaxID=45655 RepID=A0A975BGG5_9BACT|nr:Uncharacterized protein dnm_009660 [Desulfonema magnum]